MRKMKKLAGLIFSFAVILLLPSCASKEVTKDNAPKKDSVYVFDQVSPDTVKKQAASCGKPNYPKLHTTLDQTTGARISFK